jgi:hypothetical protein
VVRDNALFLQIDYYLQAHHINREKKASAAIDEEAEGNRALK